MRTTQQIFDAVIDNGFYSLSALKGSVFMCIALNSAYGLDYITLEEHEFAAGEINAYIKRSKYETYVTLAGFLADNHLPNNFEYRLKIYKDWQNRPLKNPA